MLNRILDCLNEDARMPDAEIARRVGSTPAEVASLIADARANGTIRGYRVMTTATQQPRDQVVSMVEVGLAPERERGFDRIAERIARFPEVITCQLVSGSYDLMVEVRGASLQDVAGFVSERLATIDGVKSTRTHFLLKRYKADGVILFKSEEVERLAVTP